jgi:hypothetical protein
MGPQGDGVEPGHERDLLGPSQADSAQVDNTRVAGSSPAARATFPLKPDSANPPRFVQQRR